MKSVSIICRYIGFVALLMFISSALRAETYSAQLDRSEWYLTSSIFECTLVHDIPIYGTAVFFHEAGEDLQFYTAVSRNVMAPGKAALVIEASSWRPGSGIQDLGYVPVMSGNKPLTVESKRANSMMQGLLAGRTPTFTRKSLHSNERIRVQVNSINFPKSYEGYKDCLSSLLPVNFRQVERTRVHFTVDKAVLTKEDKRKLDRVALYVLADSSVTEVYIDGHTDNSGRRIYNRRLSKARAEAVTGYLVGKGLNSDTVQTRYHGERYPVIKNSNKYNKAKNRRTTVRLVRGETLSMPSDEAPDGEVN
jgi:outer membrane protein OmpA-like peptidoglycan-associated protein